MESVTANAKEEFITRYLNKLSTVVDQNTLNIIKDAFGLCRMIFHFNKLNAQM